jgi:hypothetical protein
MGYSVVKIADIEGSGPGGCRAVRGTVLRFDSETTRCPIAGPERMTFVAIGARRGSYEARGPF